MPADGYGPLSDIAFAFLSILFEGAPFIFVGTLISGIIDAYLPPGLIDRWLPKNRVLAVMVSGLLGGVLPVCECAIVPVIRRLVQKGLPIACAITYMLSAPIINPIVVVSTLSAFTGQSPIFVASSRLMIAYFVTVLVGLIVSRFTAKDVLRETVCAGLSQGVKDAEMKRASRGAEETAGCESGVTKEEDHGHDHDHGHNYDHGHDHGHDHCHDHDHDHDHSAGAGESKLVLAMRTAMRDFLDTAMYFSIGVLITAVFNTQVPQDLVYSLADNEWMAAASLMVLAFILSLCSTSDAFIAATLQAFSYYPKLAFLVYGPMMDVKLVFMYSAVFRKRFVVVLAVGLFILIGSICVGLGIFRRIAGV